MGQKQLGFIAVVVNMGIGQTRDDELAPGVNDSGVIGTANLVRGSHFLNSPVANHEGPILLRSAARTVDDGSAHNDKDAGLALGRDLRGECTNKRQADPN